MTFLNCFLNEKSFIAAIPMTTTLENHNWIEAGLFTILDEELSGKYYVPMQNIDEYPYLLILKWKGFFSFLNEENLVAAVRIMTILKYLEKGKHYYVD